MEWFNFWPEQKISKTARFTAQRPKACGKYRKLTKTTENLPKTTEINRNQLKILQETINNDLQNVRLYKNVLA